MSRCIDRGFTHKKRPPVGAFFFAYQSTHRIEAFLLLRLEHLYRVDHHFVRLEHTLIHQHLIYLQLTCNIRNTYPFLTEFLNFGSYITPLAYYRKIQRGGFRLF